MSNKSMLFNSFLHLQLSRSDIQTLKRMGVTNWAHVSIRQSQIRQSLSYQSAQMLIKGTCISNQRLLEEDFEYFFVKVPQKYYFLMWDSFPMIGYFRVTAVRGRIVSICIFDGNYFDDFQGETKIQRFKTAITKYKALAYFDLQEKQLLKKKGVDFSDHKCFYLLFQAICVGLCSKSEYTKTIKSIIKPSQEYDLITHKNRQNIFEMLDKQVQKQNAIAKYTFGYLRAYEAIHLLDLAYAIARNFMMNNNLQYSLVQLQQKKKKHEQSYKVAFFAYDCPEPDRNLIQKLLNNQNQTTNSSSANIQTTSTPARNRQQTSSTADGASNPTSQSSGQTRSTVNRFRPSFQNSLAAPQKRFHRQ